MAKKSTIVGEYVITIHDNNSVEVFRIFDNVKQSLRTVAADLKFKIDPEWNQRQLASKLLKEFGNGERLEHKGHIITKLESGSIETCRTYSDTKQGLREVAELTGYAKEPDYDPQQQTQSFGRKLVNYIESKKV